MRSPRQRQRPWRRLLHEPTPEAIESPSQVMLLAKRAR